MKFVFFGTPEYVLPILNSLHKEFKDRRGETPIVAVVTQSPKPTGRKQEVEYSAVDTWAHKKDIPVYYDAEKLVKDGVEADMGIVASYGVIIPSSVLELFPFGLLNIHPSNLPEFRGASPVQATVLMKDIAHVSIMKIDEQMDHGPIITQFKEEIKDEDTGETLRDRLFLRSAEVLTALITPYMNKKVTLKDQDHTKATLTSMIKKEHGFIPFEYIDDAIEGKEPSGTMKIPFIYKFTGNNQKDTEHMSPTAKNIDRFIRALSPWPQVWTEVTLRNQQSVVMKKRLKILKAHIEDEKLVLDEIQLEGKNPAPWKQFKSAYPHISA